MKMKNLIRARGVVVIFVPQVKTTVTVQKRTQTLTYVDHQSADADSISNGTMIMKLAYLLEIAVSFDDNYYLPTTASMKLRSNL